MYRLLALLIILLWSVWLLLEKFEFLFLRAYRLVKICVFFARRTVGRVWKLSVFIFTELAFPRSPRGALTFCLAIDGNLLIGVCFLGVWWGWEWEWALNLKYFVHEFVDVVMEGGHDLWGRGFAVFVYFSVRFVVVHVDNLMPFINYLFDLEKTEIIIKINVKIYLIDRWYDLLSLWNKWKGCLVWYKIKA